MNRLRETGRAPQDVVAALEQLERALESEDLSPRDAATQARAIRERLAQGGSDA